MDVDSQNVRWAQDTQRTIVWCDSSEGLLQAVRAGCRDIEIGAADAGIVDAISLVAQELKSISLTGCGLDAAALGRLGLALASSTLSGVGISNNAGIDTVCWAEFWQRLPSSIVLYDFGDNELSDEAIQRLAAVLVQAGPVHELFLDGNQLTDLRPLLPLLAENVGLTELDVGDNSLGDAQTAALAPLLPVSVLTTLVLGRNAITDAGGVPIAQALPATRISVLHLDSTQIGDPTIDALIAGLATSPLEELHIDETKVTDAGILRLCRALPASRITLLDAADNNLSEATIAAIEQALPHDVEVH